LPPINRTSDLAPSLFGLDLISRADASQSTLQLSYVPANVLRKRESNGFQSVKVGDLEPRDIERMRDNGLIDTATTAEIPD
jgi:hypothetical protein